MALEKPAKLGEFFLLLCGHPDVSKFYYYSSGKIPLDYANVKIYNTVYKKESVKQILRNTQY